MQSDVPPDYMDRQTELNAAMRQILVDWLVDVSRKYRLKMETHFLTVRLVDYYLSRTQVSRKHLQLVGITAASLASKYEEVMFPQITDWVYVCDGAYVWEDVIEQEVAMLQMLHGHVRFPTAASFFRGFMMMNSSSDENMFVAQYLLELSLLDI